MDELVWGDLLIGLLVGLALGWILEWIIDARAARQKQKQHEAEVAELQAALNRALEAKTQAQKEAQAVLDRADGLQKHKEEAERQLQKTRGEKADVEAELDSAAVRLRQMTAIEQANETLRNRLNLTEERVRVLQEDLEAERAQAQEQQEQLGDLQATLQKEREQIASFDDERRAMNDKLAAAEAELALMEAQLTTAHEDLQAAQGQQSQGSALHDEVAALQEQLAEARSAQQQVESLRQENAALAMRLEAAENELVTEHNRIVAAEIKLQNMADKLTDERMRADMLEKTLSSQGDGTDGSMSELHARYGAATRELEAVRSELNETKAKAALVDKLQAENQALRARLNEAPSAAQEAPADVRRGSARADRLQRIHGIGNVFAQRLNDAGIFTFEQLAVATPERILEIVQAKEWQAVDPQEWIEQAREFAEIQEA